MPLKNCGNDGSYFRWGLSSLPGEEARKVNESKDQKSPIADETDRQLGSLRLMSLFPMSDSGKLAIKVVTPADLLSEI